MKHDTSEELNLRELWRALMRRKLILLATMVVITGAAFAYAQRQTPLYTGEALIHVQNRDAKVVQIEGVVDEMVADPATIESEIQLPTSPAFLRRNVEELNLVDDPEFNPSLLKDETEHSFLDTINPLQYIPEEWLAALQRPAPEGADVAAIKLDPASALMNSVIDMFSGRVEVAQVGRSYVISLLFMSEDPNKAADIANKMAEEYLVTQLEAKYQAAQRATEWLSKRVDELRGQVLEAEAKIVEYRTKNNLVDTSSQNNPITLQFFQLDTQLALARAQRAEAEARLSQAKSLLNSSGGIDAAALVLSSPLMDSLRSQETELIRRLADMSTMYGENHPQMVNTRAEIQSVRDKMKDEVQRIIQDDINEVAVAKTREQELTNNMGKLQGDAARVDLAAVELGDLDPRGRHQPRAVPDLPHPVPGNRRAAGAAGAGRQDPVAADVPLVPSHHRSVGRRTATAPSLPQASA